MDKQPRLLFLAYTFRPIEASATIRTWSIAKYLARLGWDITVLTPDRPYVTTPPQMEALEQDLRNSGIRRIATGHEWLVLVREYWKGPVGRFVWSASCRVAERFGIDKSIGWCKPATAACRDLKPGDVDLILATGPPFTTFQLAAKLAGQLDCPYVLDYRDAWTGNPFAVYRQKDTKVERELLERSSAVTVVSPSAAAAMERRFQLASKLNIVTNGYDPESLANVASKDFGHFAIVYTGNFYPPNRVITPLMAALGKLKTKSTTKPWKFHYYGAHENHVRKEASRFLVSDKVVCHSNVPQQEAQAATRGAGVAVVVTTIADDGTLDDQGVIPGKVYEPLGLGVPILLIAPDGSDTREIVKDAKVARCIAGKDIDGIVQFLCELLGSDRDVTSCGNGQYSWPVLAQRLDDILRRTISHDPTSAC